MFSLKNTIKLEWIIKKEGCGCKRKTTENRKIVWGTFATIIKENNHFLFVSRERNSTLPYTSVL